MSRRWTGLGLFLGVAAAYIHCAAPGVTPGDAGELIAAAATLSIPHSPSFPFFVLCSHAFTCLVPFGAVVHRVVLFSSVCGAAAITFIFLTVDTASERRLASVLCALAVATVAPMWLNSIVAEVFALHSMMVTSFLYLVALSVRGRISAERAAVLFGFLGGVAAANHQTVLFVAPAYVTLLCLVGTRTRCLGITTIAGFFAVVGLTIFLVLPIRSLKEPPLNWGHPNNAERLYRTVMRKDYGTMSLATGGAPDRTVANTARQVIRFSKRMVQEAGWPFLAAGLLGIAFGLRRRDEMTAAALAVFLFSGPIFFLLGNLPFDAQSDGITQRFYIVPIIALAIGSVELMRLRPRLASVLLASSVAFGVFANRAEASAHRRHTLVPDYAQAMLRALPKGGALYLDGGDDAFYGLATELYVRGARPDAVVHDRGGLVFPNPYGADFRSLTPAEKTERRRLVESDVLHRGPLFYSTMDRSVLPGARMAARAFLYEANGSGPGFDWPLVSFRFMYPSPTDDYRTRALGAFFPYMYGLALVDSSPLAALRAFRRASTEAGDATWLRANLAQTYAELGSGWLTANRLDLARLVYTDWIDFDGGTEAALNNLGVVCEKEGRVDEACQWYRTAAERFPNSPDPVFNLAVIDWKRGDWKAASEKFAEVIRRRPDHPTAANYLAQTRMRMEQAK